MKFEQALDIYFDRMKKENPNFEGFKEETARAMAAAWNVIAIAENTLDDLAIIRSDNSIVSIPLQKSNRNDLNEEKAKAKSVKKPDNSTGSAGE